MAGFVKEVAPREAALDEIEKRLAFPWNYKKTEATLDEAAGRRSAEAVVSPAPYPPFSRSLRDRLRRESPGRCGRDAGHAALPVEKRRSADVRSAGL